MPDDLTLLRPSPALGAEPPEFSDDAAALAFSARHARELLFAPEWGRWLRWDGARWAHDTTLAVFDLARAVCREMAAAAAGEAPKGAQWGAARLASAQKVAAVEKLARSDRRHARAAGLFDAAPWLLNTPAGVIDLRTGAARPHRPGDLFTKVTGAAPAGECPRWLAFLDEIARGDAETLAYLRRWAGYMLTGSIREHAFLFLHGPGGNGKSVLVNTLVEAMGDYAAVADMSLFTVQRSDQHPTGLAALRGARLVVASETEAGAALAEAKLKALTGGDRIAARFMRGDFFEYSPVFKLAMVGNHQPVLRNPDDAMRRRLHLLPLTFKPPSPDPELPERLRAELPGILQWAITGCAEWLRHGLGAPAVVRVATADYFADQDMLVQWLAERCEADARGKAPSAALFRDWSHWAEARGEAPGTQKVFSAALERRYAKDRRSEGVMFLGMRLKPSDAGVL